MDLKGVFADHSGRFSRKIYIPHDHFGELVAPCKRFLSDIRHTARDHDLGQSGTLREGAFPDGENGIGNGKFRDATASVKSSLPD